MRNILIRQSKDNSCSLAVLKMLLINASENISYKYLKTKRKPPYSLKTVEQIAKDEGYSVSFRKAEDKISLKENARFPFFAVIEENGSSHSVAVLCCKLGIVKIADPDKGYRYIKFKKFVEIWSGVFGYLDKEKEIKCEYRKSKIVPTSHILILSLIQLFSISSLLFGLYFIDESGNYLIPVICFSLFAILEVLRKNLSLKFMKKFDEKWLDNVFNENNKKESWIRFHSLEKNLFSSPLNLISYSISTIAIFVIGGINEPSFFLVCLLGALFSIAKNQIDILNKEKLGSNSLRLENHILMGKGDINDAKDLKSMSYKYGSYSSYSQIIFIFLLLCISIIPVLHSGIISLNFYIFQFCGVYMFSSLCLKILSFDNAMAEREKDLMYFYEYLS